MTYFPSLPDKLVNAVRKAYQEPHRHFHNWSHIQHLVKMARLLNWSLNRPEQLAALCHDLVYQPGAARGENEWNSVAAMKALLVEKNVPVTPSTLVAAEAIILATIDHEPNELAARVCDLDMAILGGTPAEWRLYRKQVRNEYPLLPDSVFNAGTIAFLEQLLAAPSIYQTPEAIARFEQQARANIAAELAALNS